MWSESISTVFLIVDIFYVKLMSPSHFKFQILCYSHAPDKCASYMTSIPSGEMPGTER